MVRSLSTIQTPHKSGAGCKGIIVQPWDTLCSGLNTQRQLKYH